MPLVLCSPSSKNTRQAESLGIRYLAAYVAEKGYSAAVVDAHCWGLSGQKAIDEVLTRGAGGPLGLQLIFHQQIDAAREIAHRYKAAFPEARVIAGGHVPTFSPKEFLQRCPEVDVVVIGEGERTLVDLLRLEEWSYEGFVGLSGVACRERGEVCATGPAALIPRIDDLPFPFRDERDFPKWRLASMVGSRGCYYKCDFCSVPPFFKTSTGSPWRLRSVENVVAEMETLHTRHGITHFSFLDDIFLGTDHRSQQRATEFALAVSARLPGIHFSIECRADAVRDGTFAALREAGLERVFVGLESGDDDQLSSYNKHLTVAQNEGALRLLHNLGIAVAYGFIMFNATTTMHALETSTDFLARLGILRARALVSRLDAYPGTPANQKLASEGALYGDPLAPQYDFRDNSVARTYADFQEVFRPLFKCDEAIKRLEFELSFSEPAERPQATRRFLMLEKAYSDLLRDAAMRILAAPADKRAASTLLSCVGALVETSSDQFSSTVEFSA